MGFFQSINPFYWRAKAQDLEKDVAVLGEAYETCKAELTQEVITLSNAYNAMKGKYDLECEQNEHLKKTVQALSVKYDYPTQFDICTGVRKPEVDPVQVVGKSPNDFTLTERKLLIDLAFVRGQNEYLENVIAELSKAAGEDVVAKFEYLNGCILKLETEQTKMHNEVVYLRKESSQLSQEKLALQSDYDDLESELERTITRAEKAEKMNKLWFLNTFGYGVDDMTVLNKSFWGKNFVVAEMPSEVKAD